MMKAFKFLFLVCGLAAVIFSCKKDHRVLSSAVQRDNDELVTLPSQKYPVYAHTVYHDSISSLNDNFKYLGSNTDGNFGNTTLGIYVNANMAISSLTFGPAPVLNKAELVLAIDPKAAFNGNSLSQLTYSVYPLDSSLVAGRSYFNTRKNLHNKNKLLGVIKKALPLSGDPLLLRLPIDSLYAAGILTNTANLVDNDAFLAAYKGYYIIASENDGEGLIFQCDLDHSESGLMLYYKPAADGRDTTYKFSFSGSKAVKFNTLTYTPGSAIASQLAGDTALGAQQLYLRGMGATRFKVQIPFLTNRSDSFYFAVNRAEVIFYLDPNVSLTGYEPPSKIALLPSDSLGKENYTIDQLNNLYAARYDGKYDAEKKCYVFNLPLHAQQILNGTRKNFGFYLVMADPVRPVTARRDNYLERIVFGGHARVAPPVLNISYTRVGKD